MTRRKNKRDLSVIIPSYNTKKLTVACVRSVAANTKGIRFEMIVVDNNSSDGSMEALKKVKFSNLKMIGSKENLGFSGANNQGVKVARGRYVLFLNSDTLIYDNVLGEMVAWMDESPKVGIASCGLRNNDGSLQETGGYFPTLLRVLAWMVIQDLPMVDRLIRPFHPRKSFYRGEKELDWVAGAFMMVSREVARKIKWDEDYFMYTEDVDYCFRAKRRGWKVVYWPRKAITHLGGASGTKEETILREFEGIKTFYRKHCPRWQYPVLRGLLKIGALGRMVVFGILGEERQRKVYAKAFSRA